MNTTVNSSHQAPRLALNRIETAQAISQSPATVDRLTKRGLLHPCRATRRPFTPSRKLNVSSRQQPLSRIGQYEIHLGKPNNFPPAFRATTGAIQRGA